MSDVVPAQPASLAVIAVKPSAGASAPAVTDRRAVAAQQLAAELALREIRAAFDGTLLLLKGLELACRYPDPTERASGDVDLLSDEPERLQEVLRSAGYEFADEADEDGGFLRWDTHHHLAPLRRASLPVVIEVHRNPGWLAGMTPPPLEDLIRDAVPSRLGIDGLMTLDPPAHAVFLAVHSWRTRPFHRRQDLDDITLLLEAPSTATEAALIARAWGVSRIWGYYRNAIGARLGQEPARLTVRLLGGGPKPRSRSIRSDYLSQQVGRLLVDRPMEHWPEITRRIRHDLQPVGGEMYREKVARTLRTVTQTSRSHPDR